MERDGIWNVSNSIVFHIWSPTFRGPRNLFTDANDRIMIHFTVEHMCTREVQASVELQDLTFISIDEATIRVLHNSPRLYNEFEEMASIDL